MHLQVVTSRVGMGTCPVCHEMKRRIEVRLIADGTVKGVQICENCISIPGVSFDVDVKPKADVEGQRRRLHVIRTEERQTAREIDGVKTLASGAVFGDGDSKNEHWMVEEKRTEADSYRLTAKTLLKAAVQAAKQSKDWVFKIRLPKHDMVLAVMRWDSALSLINGSEDGTSE